MVTMKAYNRKKSFKEKMEDLFYHFLVILVTILYCTIGVFVLVCTYVVWVTIYQGLFG